MKKLSKLLIGLSFMVFGIVLAGDDDEFETKCYKCSMGSDGIYGCEEIICPPVDNEEPSA